MSAEERLIYGGKLGNYCIGNNTNNKDESNSEDGVWDREVFHYSVEIETNESGNYSIYLPIPLISPGNNLKKGEATELMNELITVEGVIDYGISYTKYGYALCINSSNNFKILAHREFENEI